MIKKTIVIAAALVALPFTALSADKKEAKAVKPYPLKTCLVSDEDLESMGEPFVFVHQGQEVKLCCKPCQKDFRKNPAKYLKKLEKGAKSEGKK
jgi:YHS domain-containing protein